MNPNLAPPHENTLERQRQVTDFFRVRGDAMKTLLLDTREQIQKQLTAINTVVDMIDKLDAEWGIRTDHVNVTIVSVIRDRYPEQTQGKTDAEVSALVAGGLLNG